MDIITFVSYFILGYTLDYIGSGKRVGGNDSFFKPRIYFTRRYKIHIHHYLFYVLALIIIISFGYFNEFIYGFLTGGIAHSLTFKDRLKIIMKK